MKKALAIILAFVVLIVCACNTDKAKINNISVENVEYKKESNTLVFDVEINPNRFDELKVYFISKEAYDSNQYGDYFESFTNKLEEGKFTLSLEGKEKKEYVLFAWTKAFDQNEYQSECIKVDLTGEEVTIDSNTSK